MIANLEIGYLTPPVGLNLIVAMAAFKESFGTHRQAGDPLHHHHAVLAGDRHRLSAAVALPGSAPNQLKRSLTN